MSTSHAPFAEIRSDHKHCKGTARLSPSIVYARKSASGARGREGGRKAEVTVEALSEGLRDEVTGRHDLCPCDLSPEQILGRIHGSY